MELSPNLSDHVIFAYPLADFSKVYKNRHLEDFKFVWSRGIVFSDSQVYKVLGRTPSGLYQFVVMAPYSDEFFRELLMNVFLYFPLGLTLGELIGWHRIWLALVLAIVIESWQYAAGTGMAQVTDVICNTLGAWIGGIAFQKRKHCL